jgi:hypothetical protein
MSLLATFFEESSACKVVEHKKLPQRCLIEKSTERVFTVKKLVERLSAGAWLS